MRILEDLNEEQREAVLYDKGPILVLAGAGTGKTRVLTYKIAYFILKGVPPEKILALTFTNKASEEMLERVRNLVGEKSLRMFIGTFHSFCLRILRNELSKVGRSSNFIVYDEEDQLACIKEVIKELGLDRIISSPRNILYLIERAKDTLIDPESYLLHSKAKFDYYREEVAKVYKAYQDYLKRMNAFDFGDLIMEVVKLFKERNEILKKYEDNFDWILVDEYQDTNYAQYILLKMLARKKRKIFVVGDEDQAIYAWRGATIQNILKFEREWEGCKVVKLEKNYRSTERILFHASKLISHNISRYSKNLYSVKGGGYPVIFRRFPSCEDEGRGVCLEILKLVNEGYNFEDIAVFYRTNAQSRIIEEMMRRYNINYEIVGSVSFYERKEIKDIISYLVVIAEPKQDMHLLRIINIPSRGIGKTTVERLKKFAGEKGTSIYEFIKNDELNFLKKGTRKSLKDFVNLIERLRGIEKEVSVSELVKELVKEIKYFEYLDSIEKEGVSFRKDNVGEFISSCVEFEENNEIVDLREFLNYLSLITPYDEYKREGGRVTLMTLHLAKGLEFKVVFITGLEEGILPYRDALYDPEELEEERRLFYVGMTRAKERLYLSCVYSRMLYGTPRFLDVSRFIEEAEIEVDYDRYRAHN